MKRKVKPISKEYRTLTPMLTVSDGAGAIEFYKNAFGAEERYRMLTPDGKHVVHAELKIGDSIFMLGDEMPGQDCRSPEALGGTPWDFTCTSRRSVPEEMARRGQEFCQKMMQSAGPS